MNIKIKREQRLHFTYGTRFSQINQHVPQNIICGIHISKLSTLYLLMLHMIGLQGILVSLDMSRKLTRLGVMCIKGATTWFLLYMHSFKTILFQIGIKVFSWYFLWTSTTPPRSTLSIITTSVLPSSTNSTLCAVQSQTRSGLWIA